MPPLQKGPTSGLAAAARVLFDSAQRTGAVQPLEQSSKQYAQQLKSIQAQSKKRGGSLGGVSYKVSEFLATQRTPAPQHTRATPGRERSIAKKVPLIDIPTMPATPVGKLVSSFRKEEVPKAAPPPPLPSLSSLFPDETARAAKPSVVPAPTARAAASPPPVGEPPSLVEADDAVTGATAAAADSRPAAVEEVLITEDTPVFEVRQSVAPQPALDVVVVQTPAAATAESPIPARRPTPVISIPIAMESPAGEASAASAESSDGPGADGAAAATAELSVDVWEQQREREMERLQRKREEEEQRRLAAVREKEHETLGQEWADRRTQSVTFEAEPTVGSALLLDLYKANSASSAVAVFQKMLDVKTRTTPLLPAAIASTAYHIGRAPESQRRDLKNAVFGAVEKARLSEPLVRKAHLHLSGGTSFLEAFEALLPAEKRHLDERLILKALPLLVLSQQWAAALELAKECRPHFRSHSDAADLALLRHCFVLEEGPRKEVVAYASQSLTESGRMGQQAKLLIASAERGAFRRTLLKQLTASSDVDESVYAELIMCSGVEQMPGLLAEMTSRGLNGEDPVVLAAAAMKSLHEESPMAVFKEIDRQVAKIGIRPFHIRVAAKTVARHPTDEVVRAAVALLLRLSPEARSSGLRKLFPVLYEHEKYDAIAELADATNEAVPLTKLLPRGVAFVNEALIRVGRQPLNEVRVSDIGFSRKVAAATGAGTPDRVAAQPAREVADLGGLTEKMLLYAKERQWQKALEVVEGLPHTIKAEASAVTLLYNCAMSAAVEQPETVKSIHALMTSRAVVLNATTVNTVLSSVGRSPLWAEALDFFTATPLAQRDTNTYLVYFALLGKHNMWKEATEAYDELRGALPKPPSALFSLIIGTTSGHDWQATLRVFQDMLRLHGATVKESVVTQVIRCLERNGKTAEIAKLEKELAKRKKKKK